MSGQSKALRIARRIGKRPFAFPGGYRIHAITDDSGVLCSKCCKDEERQIATSYPGDGWRVVDAYIHYEGEPVACDHCGTEFPSEYEPDQTNEPTPENNDD